MLTADEYRAQASAICQHVNGRLANEMPQGGLVEPLAFAEEVARESYEALSALEPPGELAQLHGQVLVRLHILLAAYPDLLRAAKKGMTAFTRVSAEQREANQTLGGEVETLWRRLGVPECNH